MEMNKLKDIRLQQYLMSKKLMKMYSPYSDTDKDGVINMLDCYPFDKKRHALTREEAAAVLQAGGQISYGREGITEVAPTLSRQEAADVLQAGGQISYGAGGRITEVTPTPAPKVYLSRQEAATVLKLGGKISHTPQGIELIQEPPPDKFGLGWKTIAKGQTLGLEPDQVVGEFEAEQLRPAEREPSVISAYVPKTEEEIAETKRLQEELERERTRKKIGGFFTGFTGLLPFPWRKEKEEKEREILKEGEKYVVVTKEGEPEAAYTVSPTEVPVYAGLSEQNQLAKQTEQDLITKYQLEGQQKVNDLVRSSQSTINDQQKRLQEDVTAGKISVENAQKKLDALVQLQNKSITIKTKTLNQTLNSQMQKEFETILTPKFKEIAKTSEAKAKQEVKKWRLKTVKATLPLTILAGGIIGTASFLVPPIGALYSVAYGGRLLTHIPETIETFKASPLATSLETAGFIGGALAGGYITGKVTATQKISGAISRSRAVSTYKDLTTVKQVMKLHIPKNSKPQLVAQINKGNSVRVVYTRLVATRSGDVKFLPQVRGTHVEYLTRNGVVIDRFAVGQVVGKFKGKTLTTNAINQAIGKLEGGKISFAGKNLLLREQALKYDLITGRVLKGYKPLKYYETFETLELLKTEQKGFAFRLTGKGKIEIIKTVTKPKAGQMIQFGRRGKLTEAQLDKALKVWGRGKPYGEADIIFAGKLIRGKIRIPTPKGDVLTIGLSRTDLGIGKSVFSRIITQAKKTKFRGWKDVTEASIKPPKFKPPKIPKGGQTLISGYAGLKLWQKYMQQELVSQDYSVSTIGGALTGASAWAGRLGLISGAKVSVAGVQLRKQAQQLQLRSQQLQQQLAMPVTRLKAQQLTAQQLKLSQRTAQLQKLFQPSPVTPTTPPITPITPPPFIHFAALPFFPIDKAAGKRRRQRASKYVKGIKKAYQPSVGAVVLGIYAKKKPFKLTGLELRPIISKKKGKKKGKSIKRKDNYLQNVNKILL